MARVFTCSKLFLSNFSKPNMSIKPILNSWSGLWQTKRGWGEGGMVGRREREEEWKERG